MAQVIICGHVRVPVQNSSSIAINRFNNGFPVQASLQNRFVLLAFKFMRSGSARCDLASGKCEVRVCSGRHPHGRHDGARVCWHIAQNHIPDRHLVIRSAILLQSSHSCRRESITFMRQSHTTRLCWHAFASKAHAVLDEMLKVRDARGRHQGMRSPGLPRNLLDGETRRDIPDWNGASAAGELKLINTMTLSVFCTLHHWVMCDITMDDAGNRMEHTAGKH